MRHVEFRHIFMCGYVLKLVYAGLRPADATPFFFFYRRSTEKGKKNSRPRRHWGLMPVDSPQVVMIVPYPPFQRPLLLRP